MLSYPFFKMAAGSRIGFDLGNVKPSAIVGLRLCCNVDKNPTSVGDQMVNIYIHHLFTKNW